MSNIKVQASPTGTGVVTLTAPTTNTDRTVTLPDQTGTVYITGGSLGTPSSAVLTNATGLPLTTGVTGTLPVANGGTGVTTSTGTGSVVLSNSPTLVTPALGTPSSGNGSNLTNLNASNISSGTVPTARLATGTANSTTFLRGDQTWATAGGAPANLGDIGAVLLAAINTASSLKFGDTVAGSNCYYATTITQTTGSGSNIFSEGTTSPPTTNWGWSTGYVSRTTNGNTGYTAPGGSATLSGTWRVLSMVGARSSGYGVCDNQTNSLTRFGLIQRIS